MLQHNGINKIFIFINTQENIFVSSRLSLPFLITTFCLIFLALSPAGVFSNLLDDKHLLENNLSNPRLSILDIRQELVDKNYFSASQLVNSTIYSGNKQQSHPFIIKNNGKVLLQSQLDRELICPISRPTYGQEYVRNPKSDVDVQKCPSECCKILPIEVKIDATGRPQSFYVKIIVDDLNDHAPSFQYVKKPFIVQVKENVPIGFRIRLPTAYDQDSWAFSVKTYSIRTWTDDSQSHFKLSTKDNIPYLYVIKPLDREDRDHYSFTLWAIDGGNPSRSNSIEISIQVTDINDNAPTFDKKLYVASVKEHMRQPKDLFNFQVRDDDTGRNARIQLRIHDPTLRAQRFFSVKKKTNGVDATLKLTNDIDYERLGASKRFNFFIIASDSSTTLKRTSSASVIVRVTNINDKAPRIFFMHLGRQVDRVYHLREDTKRGTVIAQVHVNDTDSSWTQIKCHVVQEAAYFTIEENQPSANMNWMREIKKYKQFSLRLIREIDREKQAKFSVIVECTDNDNTHPLKANGSLRIHLIDLNDNDPQFLETFYTGFVPENKKGATISLIKKVAATDNDAGRNAMIDFSLEDEPGHEGDASKFHVDSYGKISTRVALDYETKTSYKFNIVVCDRGEKPRSATAPVSVSVRDINDNPPELIGSPFSFHIAEDVPAHSEIGKVTAIDKDTLPANTKIQYSLRSQNSDLHLVKINKHSGILTTYRALDHETQSTLTFTVVAENTAVLTMAPNSAHFSPTAEATIMITIDNVNDNAPEFELTQDGVTHISFIWEQLGAHRMCEPTPYKVVDKDNDNYDECCDLMLKNDYGGIFELMPETHNSMICVHKKPPHPRTYKLSLSATDRAGNKSLTSSITFTVMIKSDPRNRLPTPNINTLPYEKSSPSQLTLFIVLACIAGAICILLFVVIIIFKKCSVYNTDFDENKLRQGMQDDHNIHKSEDAEKQQPELGSLLPDAMQVYYSQDEVVGADNNYQLTGTALYRRNKMRTLDSREEITRLHNRFSKSCDSINDTFRASGEYPNDNSQFSKVTHMLPFSASTNIATARRNMNNKEDLNQPNIALYHSPQEFNDNPGVSYQTINSYSEAVPGGYTSYRSQQPSGRMISEQNTYATYHLQGQISNSSELSKKSDLKKSLRNVYFQTSFV